MKKFVIFIVMFLIVLSVKTNAQNFTLTIQNQSVNGTEFTFDIYMLRTGVTDIYLGSTDLALIFNDGNFTSDTYSIVQYGDGSNKLYNYYGFSASIISSNILMINISKPSFSDQTQFDQRVQIISNTGNGTQIGSFKVTTVSNPSGTAGLQWRTSGENRTIVNNLDNTDPWNETDISGNGNYVNPSDQSLPVQMANFYATAENGQGIIINWHTESELNTIGYNILRSRNKDDEYIKINNSLISVEGNSSSGNNYSFIDRQIENQVLYWYKIEEVDVDGSCYYYGPINVIGVKTKPDNFYLSQNYPNPFNPYTFLKFELPEKSNVVISIYSLLGKMVKEWEFNDKEAGYHELRWDGKDKTGNKVSSGIYILNMKADDFSQIRKMTLLR